MITKKSKSFSLIEVILAIALFALLVSLVAGTIIYAKTSNLTVANHTRAMNLAREGIEAAKQIRNGDFASVADGTHGVVISGGAWALSGSYDRTDIYERTIDIATVDSNTKNVSSTVKWIDIGTKQNEVKLESLITNWKVVQPSDWTEPEPEPIDLPDAVNGLKIQTQGDYAYVIRQSDASDSNRDFIVVDITNPDVPKIKGSVNLAGEPTNIAVLGNYAYVSSKNDSQELQIVDISNPDSPRQVGSFNAGGSQNANGVVVQGNYAYIVREISLFNPEFYVIDISTPTAPRAAGSTNFFNSSYDLTISGDYAYLASGFVTASLNLISMVQIIDIKTPSSPSVKKTYSIWDDWGGSYAIASQGNKIVVGQESPGNKIYIFEYNSTSPDLIVKKSSFSVGGRVYDISFGGNDKYVYLATNASDGEFQIVDVTNTSSPSLVGKTDLSDQLNGVSYSPTKDRVYAVGPSTSAELIIIKPK